MKAAGALGHLVEKIRSRFGLDYGGSRLDVLLEGLTRIAPNAEAAAAQLACADRDALAEFVGSITNTETYFFRHAEQFSALRVLIERHWAQHPPISYRAWCAGCSTGEEPLTVSAVLDDVSRLNDPSPLTTVLATDINPSALRQAQNARYTEWSFRGVLADQRERYFVKEGTHYVPRRALLERITFRRHNLLDPAPEPVPFDLVVCRNVLIYFDGEQLERAVNRLALAVAPGGILVLGPVESAAASLPDFDVLHPGACIVYRKRHAFLEPSVPRGWNTSAANGASAQAPRSAPPLPPPVAASRPPARAPLRPPAEVPAVAPQAEALTVRLAQACGLADQGRLAEARAAAESLQRDFGDRGELQILTALILLEEDRHDEAASQLEAVVAARPDLAMAHYLLGSTLDTGGARNEAASSYRRALLALDEKPPEEPVAGGGGLTVADLSATLAHLLRGQPEKRR
ncbi:MAG: protein-glutamate O-methyltransferase CheR [Archangium sp.]|nr:protein-glutamate O-methyltransferase CheR [Archangium sp.]MDP3574551.1 protein-glutamate O-methyltransferase CheR [Archangium sp.]